MTFALRNISHNSNYQEIILALKDECSRGETPVNIEEINFLETMHFSKYIFTVQKDESPIETILSTILYERETLKNPYEDLMSKYAHINACNEKSKWLLQKIKEINQRNIDISTQKV